MLRWLCLIGWLLNKQSLNTNELVNDWLRCLWLSVPRVLPVLTCANQIKPHVTSVYTVWWHGTNLCLPRGTKWGLLVSHIVAWWGPQWWGGPIMNCHVAYRVEVASLCAAIWHLFSLLCTTHTLPSGSNADVASDVAQLGLAICLWVVWHGWMVSCHVAWTGWGGPLVDCHVALWWDPPVRWLVSRWDPLADMDQ
jgi:hypothetical protein